MEKKKKPREEKLLKRTNFSRTVHSYPCHPVEPLPQDAPYTPLVHPVAGQLLEAGLLEEEVHRVTH